LSAVWSVENWVCWTVDLLHCFENVVCDCPANTARIHGKGIPLCNLLVEVVQSLNLDALEKFNSVSMKMKLPTQGSIQLTSFADSLIVRAWPKGHVEWAWSIELIISVGSGMSALLNTTVTVLPRPEFAALFIPPVAQKITALSIVNAVTPLAASRAVVHAMENTFPGSCSHLPITTCRADDTTVTISCPLGITIDLYCSPQHGKFRFCVDSQDPAWMRHLHACDKGECILTSSCCHL